MSERPIPYRPESAQNQTPHEGGKPPPETQERQPLTGVWEVLERDVRLDERYDENRLTGQEADEYDRELGEVKRLANEIRKKGTVYDKLILDLYSTITLEPSGLPVLIPYNRSLSREEFHQFRSKVERLSEEGLSNEIRKAQEDFKRREEAHPGRRPPPPDSIINI